MGSTTPLKLRAYMGRDGGRTVQIDAINADEKSSVWTLVLLHDEHDLGDSSLWYSPIPEYVWLRFAARTDRELWSILEASPLEDWNERLTFRFLRQFEKYWHSRVSVYPLSGLFDDGIIGAIALQKHADEESKVVVTIEYGPITPKVDYQSSWYQSHRFFFCVSKLEHGESVDLKSSCRRSFQKGVLLKDLVWDKGDPFRNRRGSFRDMKCIQLYDRRSLSTCVEVKNIGGREVLILHIKEFESLER